MSAINVNQVKNELREFGFSQFPAMFSTDTIDDWNARINQAIKKQADSARHYLRADQLHEIGIVDELLNSEFVHLIHYMMPDAELYHLHCYDSPALASKPHIHGDNGLDGWHRDDDCLYAFEESQYHFFSYFIYLTDVEEKSGPFEVCALKANEPLVVGTPTRKMMGQRGSNFVFDRTNWHRATTNVSSHDRRVIKLSFQNRYLANDRIGSKEFAPLRRSPLMEESVLRQWFHCGQVELDYVSNQ